MTNEIIEEIKDKDLALRIARRSGKAEDWVAAKRERNRVGRLVEQSKSDFLRDQQEELADDPKKFWRLIKSIVPGKKSGNCKITLVDKEASPEGVEINGERTADFINDFFSNIGPNLAKKHKEPWLLYKGDDDVQADPQPTCPNFITDYNEVLKLCKDINSSKSSGFDDISAKVFKDAFRVVIPQLVYLFNSSFTTGVFPTRWKCATIIPLYKGGDKTEVSNYRPVSLLPLPGKIIEKLVHSKMLSFMNENGIISEKQGGFRKGFSTASTIVDITNRLFANIDEGLTSLAAFIDLRKAFDTVNHGILIKKLQCYGVDSLNLLWCENYLSRRVQRTMVNGLLSSMKFITCGVPQGSVLGPLFFILYMNDLQFAVKNAQIQLYADDTVIHVAGESSEEAAQQMQPALNSFSKWCSANKLSLNTSKTKMMVFGTRQKVKKAKGVILRLEGTQLQVVPTYKYLGFILDSVLTFNCHVKNVSNMVAYKTNLLGRIRKFLNDDVALKIYKSMILPYFDYGDVIYNSAGKDGLEKLQRLQNKCLKICKRLDVKFSTKELHRITKTSRLDDRRSAHINNFMYGRLGRDHL